MILHGNVFLAWSAVKCNLLLIQVDEEFGDDSDSNLYVRNYAVQELVVTERTYVSGLNTLVENYLRPIKARITSPPPNKDAFAYKALHNKATLH